MTTAALVAVVPAAACACCSRRIVCSCCLAKLLMNCGGSEAAPLTWTLDVNLASSISKLPALCSVIDVRNISRCALAVVPSLDGTVPRVPSSRRASRLRTTSAADATEGMIRAMTSLESASKSARSCTVTTGGTRLTTCTFGGACCVGGRACCASMASVARAGAGVGAGLIAPGTLTLIAASDVNPLPRILASTNEVGADVGGGTSPGSGSASRANGACAVRSAPAPWHVSHCKQNTASVSLIARTVRDKIKICHSPNRSRLREPT